MTYKNRYFYRSKGKIIGYFYRQKGKIIKQKRCALPQTKGGYHILSEFIKDGSTKVLKSRRYIKVGKVDKPILGKWNCKEIFDLGKSKSREQEQVAGLSNSDKGKGCHPSADGWHPLPINYKL